ncbi:adrenocortical dysplasia protein homolog [Leptodactylus fuscus]|uniref:adrenocortical dysplasia protein homolog n=1 Tax=Leptodactylus fuscus TaxID=238119 RepID=UPI003F4F11F3
MAGFHSFIGYAWIIDSLAKYDSAVVKQKPVPGQVIEFLRMPDRSVSSEDGQYPEVVVNISDQKYYIKAVITKEAQEKLESEDEHFTLVDIKNKIIILKQFSVCFTADEDLRRCEFYLTVQHFSILPMETNTVDILNCNMEPGVRKKIKELWQNYMTELEMNETSSDMNMSDTSLTQLLMVASEEKFSTLKSIAEQCLELDRFATQDSSLQSSTLWSIERKRNKENKEIFNIPIDLLLIPPHEEATLEQMTEFGNEGQCPSELTDSSEEDNSSQPYSSALSTLSEEAINEGPSSQSGNPWNNLQSLCVSLPTSSDSMPKFSPSNSQKSRRNEVGSDPDSSTPDALTSDTELTIGDSTKHRGEISPLMFSEHSSNPQEPSKSIAQTDCASSSTSPKCKKSSSTKISSLSLIPLTQDSPPRSPSVSSKVQISPIKSCMLESKGSPASKTDPFFLSVERNRGKCCSPRTRKALKRKQTSEDLKSTLSDLEQQEPENVERPDCVTTTDSFSVEIDDLSDNDNGVQTVVKKQIRKRDVANMGKIDRKTEQCIKTHVTKNHTSSKKRIQANKPSLQFVAVPKIQETKDSASSKLTAKVSTSKTCVQKAPSKEPYGQLSSFQAREKGIVPITDVENIELTHRDGTPFQYKYKPPSEDLCAHVNAIQLPADLCEWAMKMLSEDQGRVL